MYCVASLICLLDSKPIIINKKTISCTIRTHTYDNKISLRVSKCSFCAFLAIHIVREYLARGCVCKMIYYPSQLYQNNWNPTLKPQLIIIVWISVICLVFRRFIFPFNNYPYVKLCHIRLLNMNFIHRDLRQVV